MKNTTFNPSDVINIDIIADRYWILTLSPKYENQKIVLEDTMVTK